MIKPWMFKPYRNLPSTEHLVGYWPFDETSGTNAPDLSGNGNDGTLVNMEDADWVDGVVGKCLDFGGVDEYVSVADYAGFDIGGAVTASVWFKTSANQKSIGLVMHDLSAYKYMLYLTNDSRTPIFYVVTASGVTGAAYAGEFADGEWHHLVGTFDKTLGSNRVKVFIDGILRAQEDGYAEDIIAGDEGITIGTWQENYFNGLIDEVRIYSTALTASEIKALFDYPGGV